MPVPLSGPSMAVAYVVGLAYFAVLSVAAWSRAPLARGRWPAAAGMAATGALAAVAAGRPGGSFGLVPDIVVPSLVLLVGYWTSGLFFVGPMPAWERRLLASDEALLHRPGLLRWYRGAPRVLHEYFELAYLLVYAVVPAGGVVLAVMGRRHALGAYWAIVLLAELMCYATLPWLQTRPPRALEDDRAESGGVARVRRLNLALARRASIQANTIPSGHAAGAVAVALAVASELPMAGVVFLVVALSIVLATVLGRYHYAVDSILGVIVALAAWAAIRLAR